MKTFAMCSGTLLVLTLQLFPAGSAGAAASEREDVTVDGPYTVRQEVTKQALRGRPPEMRLSASQTVSYADLDLSNPSDMEKLRSRVKSAAKDSCNELDLRFPRDAYIPDQSRYQCMKTAMNDALAQVGPVTGQSVARADISPAMPR